MNSIQKIEIIELDNQLVIDSRIVSQGLDIDHLSFMRAIYKYQTHLETFGSIRFEIETNSFIKKDGKKGASVSKYCFLNKPQVCLIAALSRNSEPVVDFKTNLILAFDQVCEDLKAATSQIKSFKDKTLKELTEDEIRDALILLDSRNFSRWRWEASYSDPLRPPLPQGERTRRFDAIAKFGRVIRILELKAKPITSSEVAEILDDRGYLEVAASHNPGKCLDIVLCAPSIADSGKRALERLNAQDQYQEFTVSGFTYRAKIRFVSIHEFAQSIATKTLNETPQTAKWISLKEINRYSPLFSERYLSACKQLFSVPSNVLEPA